MENVRKHSDIKLVTTEEKRIKLVSEPNYHTTKHFSDNLLAIEMKKTKVKMNKPVYLGMSIIDISKTIMYEFWYDYVKPKYKDKAKLCYMDTDSFVINIFTEDFFEDINNDVERWFDTSNYDKNDKRPLQIGVNKKVIGMFKDELGGKIMKEFCALRAKTYTYLTEDDSEHKKSKGTKKHKIKRRLMFENYKDSLFNDETIMRSQLRFKSNLEIEIKVEIKDYNVMIDGKNVFNQPIKNDKVTHENIRKIATGQGDDDTTGCLLDYTYLKKYCKMIAIDLSKQQALHADPKAIQQINFTANLDKAGNTRFCFTLEEAKEPVFEFSQGTVKIL